MDVQQKAYKIFGLTPAVLSRISSVFSIALVFNSEFFAAQSAASDRPEEFARIPPLVVQIVKLECLAKQAWDPAISPNESMLAFAKLDVAEEGGFEDRAPQAAQPIQPIKSRGDDREMNGVAQIWVMELDGMVGKKLTSGSASSSKPVFHANGESILFVRAPGDLWVVKTDGSSCGAVTLSTSPACCEARGIPTRYYADSHLLRPATRPCYRMVEL